MILPPLLFIAIQPSEPSILPSAAMISNPVGRSSSNPPWLCGTNMRKTPIDLSASARSGGIRRASSISAARAVMPGASSRMSASRRLAVFAFDGVSKATLLITGRPTRRSVLMVSTPSGGLFQIYSGGGSVAVPGRLRGLETKVLSPQADILEQMVVELAQLLSRAIAVSPQPDGGGDPMERRQRRDTPRAGAMRQPFRKWRRRRRPQGQRCAIEGKDG